MKMKLLIVAVVLFVLLVATQLRSSTTVSLCKDGHTQRLTGLKIFDVKGRLVYEADSLHEDSFTWNGYDKHGNPVSSGLYILQATDANNKKHLAKIVRMK